MSYVEKYNKFLEEVDNKLETFLDDLLPEGEKLDLKSVKVYGEYCFKNTNPIRWICVRNSRITLLDDCELEYSTSVLEAIQYFKLVDIIKEYRYDIMVKVKLSSEIGESVFWAFHLQDLEEELYDLIGSDISETEKCEQVHVKILKGNVNDYNKKWFEILNLKV